MREWIPDKAQTEQESPAWIPDEVQPTEFDTIVQTPMATVAPVTTVTPTSVSTPLVQTERAPAYPETKELVRNILFGKTAAPTMQQPQQMVEDQIQPTVPVQQITEDIGLPPAEFVPATPKPIIPEVKTGKTFGFMDKFHELTDEPSDIATFVPFAAGAKELADIASVASIAYKIDHDVKPSDKEMVKLNKKEPNIIKVAQPLGKLKDVKYHKQVPKEKEQKFFNHNYKEKRNINKEN